MAAVNSWPWTRDDVEPPLGRLGDSIPRIVALSSKSGHRGADFFNRLSYTLTLMRGLTSFVAGLIIASPSRS
jgi:hypothetical protein